MNSLMFNPFSVPKMNMPSSMGVSMPPERTSATFDASRKRRLTATNEVDDADLDSNNRAGSDEGQRRLCIVCNGPVRSRRTKQRFV